MPPSEGHVRVDTGFRAGDEVSPFYDPMLAKLIVWGPDRERARTGLLRALAACEVVGVATNVELLARIAANPDFAAGNVDTGLIDRHRDTLLAAALPPDDAFEVAALAEFAALRAASEARARASADRWSPWNALDAWWNGSSAHVIRETFEAGGETRTVEVKPLPDDRVQVDLGGRRSVMRVNASDDRLHVARDDRRVEHRVVRAGDVRHVFGGGLRAALTRIDPLARAGEEPAHAGHLMAPMSGTIVAVMVKAGDRVAQGAPLVALEAMKMEHTIAAPAAGIVTAVNCAVGERVAEGTDLVDLDDLPT
jgi:3-methylcrotonyl-CoA carboxylase alpha subunit